MNDLDAVWLRIGDRPFGVVVNSENHIEVFPVEQPFSLYRFVMRCRFPRYNGHHYQPMDHLDRILAAISNKAKKAHPRMCCPLAISQLCVCEVSYSCMIHGGGCVGDHADGRIVDKSTMHVGA